MTKVAWIGMVTSMLLIATAANATVPELDPGSASLGVALLVGGWLVFNGRRRQR